MKEILIDGSQGEGGGQILRTSLGLAMVTGKNVRVEKIRAGREKPGIMRQHLAAVRAAMEICDAEVGGDELGSMTLDFSPKKVRAGKYHFAVGSAGSTGLVLQTVLPGLLMAEGESEIEIEGGTHNPWAPPFDFLARCFLPVLGRMGAAVMAELERPGFYPAGGGRFRVKVTGGKKLGAVELFSRGEIVRRQVRAVFAGLPRHVAERELAAARRRLADWPAEGFVIEEAASAEGPGNVLVAEIESAGEGGKSAPVCEVVTAFGMKGLTAEAVAEELVKGVRKYIAAGVPVGEHLADQLMVPLALAGAGGFVTGALSAHARTNLAVIEKFLPGALRVSEREGQVRVEGARG